MKNVILEAARRAYATEGAAVEFLEARRWRHGEACPRCGDTNVYKMQDAVTGKRNKDYRWRCRGCKKMYTVRTGTVMEESRLDLRVWVYAFVHAATHKKGIAALRIAQEFGLNYESALFLMHRIRYAMKPREDAPLKGTVETDETYVGGKPRNKRAGMQGVSDKQPVVAMVQRGGDIRYRVMDRVTSANLGAAMKDNIDPSSRLMTDALLIYRPIGKMFQGGHGWTNHAAGEYARGDVHSNTIESAFSLLKRGLYGTFHSVSRHHLHRYCDEFAFRWNHRASDDGERTTLAIQGGEGKRLVYRDSSTGAA